MRLLLIFFFLLLTGCEGFKVLLLHNVSCGDARVTIKPNIPPFDKRNISNYPAEHVGDSLVMMLPNDSSVFLLSIFTTMMNGAKIRPSNLRIDYLKIETKKDTIIADSKEKIIDLIKDPRTRYRRKTDPIMTNAPNFGNIMIR